MASEKSEKKTKPPTKLYRSEDNRVIAGVCAGLGEFFQIDPSIVRLIFVIITIFGGGGILLYLILWLIIPSDSSESELTKDNIRKNADEIKDKAKDFAKEMRLNSTNVNSRQLIGIIILIFGILLLLGNFGIFNFINFWKFFPAIIIIVLGIHVLRKSE